MPTNFLMDDIDKILGIAQSGGAETAGGAGESFIDRFLNRAKRGEFGQRPPGPIPGQAPGINPAGQDPNEFLSQLSAQNAADPRSLAGGINDLAQPLLQKLGPIGRGFSKGVDFLEQVGDVGRGVAERGGLNALAPNFSAGVQGAAQRELDEAFRRSQIELSRERNAITAQNTNASAGNVQSVQKGENGNFWVFTRGSAEPIDTGIKFDKNVELVPQKDGSVVAINRTTGERLADAVTPEQAADANLRSKQNDAGYELPVTLAGLDTKLAGADAVMETLDRVEEDVSPGTSGLSGAIAGGIPGTAAYDLRANVKTIQANLGFDELQAMRAASKTGGALGQVSERELDLLISAVNSLDPNQSDEQLRENIALVRKHYNNYKREIDVMKNLMREQAGKEPAADEVPNFSEMTDQQLKDYINATS